MQQYLPINYSVYFVGIREPMRCGSNSETLRDIPGLSENCPSAEKTVDAAIRLSHEAAPRARLHLLRDVCLNLLVCSRDSAVHYSAVQERRRS